MSNIYSAENPYYGDTREGYLWRLGYAGKQVPDYPQDMDRKEYKEGVAAARQEGR